MMSEVASKVKCTTEKNDGYSSEEEELVYVTFDTVLDSDFMQPETPFKLIGVDEEQPILQLGSQVYAGIWKDTLGTAVFFEEDPTAENGDPVFTKNPSKMLRYHSKTRKNLAMTRVFINPKDRTNVNSSCDGSGNVDSENSHQKLIEEQAGCSHSETNNHPESVQGKHFMTESDPPCDESSAAMDTESACEEESFPTQTQSVMVSEEQPSCSYGPYTIPKRER